MSTSWTTWLETSQSPSQWRTLRERIATRAYFLSQWANRSESHSDVDIWLEAERIELAAQPRVDCVFDDEYDGWDQLGCLPGFFKQLNISSTSHVITHDDVVRLGDQLAPCLRELPADALVFSHCDSNTEDDVKGIAVTQYLERVLGKHRLIGNSSLYAGNCVRKSSMFRLFSAAKLRTPATVVVKRSATSAQLDAQIDDVNALLRASSAADAAFCKLDDGYDSQESGIVRGDARSILEQALVIAQKVGRDAVLQPLLSGREWTVAVAAGRAYAPIQSLFADGEAFKPSGGTRGGEAVERDEATVEQLQQLAAAAFAAVGGGACDYGRVDIRENGSGAPGDFSVLECNPMCSLTPNSFFELSLIGANSSMPEFLATIIRNALDAREK